MTTAPAEFLAWDSDFFGRRIARVRDHRLDEPAFARLLAWSLAEQIDCLYLLADAADPATSHLAARAGFSLVDVRMTFAGELNGDPPAPAFGIVRPASPSDVPALRALAQQSHHDSRFYSDPHFDRERCDELYATWIEQRVPRRDGAVWINEDQGRLAGYVTCETTPDPADRARGRIGLIAVAADVRRRGVGSALLGAAGRWFQRAGAAPVRVVTQGRNLAAQRLYARHRLRIESVELWYHRWTIRDQEGRPR